MIPPIKNPRIIAHHIKIKYSLNESKNGFNKGLIYPNKSNINVINVIINNFSLYQDVPTFLAQLGIKKNYLLLHL
jgi:hypothetical protein